MALQLKYSSRAIPGKPLKRKSTEDETMNSQEIGNFYLSGSLETVAEIFRGQEAHGMLVVYCKCITVSPKGYLVLQRF